MYNFFPYVIPTYTESITFPDKIIAAASPDMGAAASPDMGAAASPDMGAIPEISKTFITKVGEAKKEANVKGWSRFKFKGIVYTKNSKNNSWSKTKVSQIQYAPSPEELENTYNKITEIIRTGVTQFRLNELVDETFNDIERIRIIVTKLISDSEADTLKIEDRFDGTFIIYNPSD